MFTPDDDSSSSSSSTRDKVKSGAKAAGRSLSESGQSMMSDARSEAASRVGPVSYRRGGKVRKTGMAKLHRGERVVPRGKVKRVEKMMRKGKMRMKASRRG
jgi:hypothetical protein